MTTPLPGLETIASETSQNVTLYHQTFPDVIHAAEDRHNYQALGLVSAVFEETEFNAGMIALQADAIARGATHVFGVTVSLAKVNKYSSRSVILGDAYKKSTE